MRRHSQPIVRDIPRERRVTRLGLVASFFGCIAAASVISAAFAKDLQVSYSLFGIEHRLSINGPKWLPEKFNPFAAVPAFNFSQPLATANLVCFSSFALMIFTFWRIAALGNRLIELDVAYQVGLMRNAARERKTP